MNPTQTSRHRALAIGLAATTAGLWATPSPALVTSNGGNNPPFTGRSINAFTGATRFYDGGYTGSRSVVLMMQTTDPWNGHETLTHVTTNLRNPDIPALPHDANYDGWVQYDTGVAGVHGGRQAAPFPGEYQRGIAFGADLWTGSVATSVTASSFSISRDSFRYPLHTAFVTGVGGRTADVAFIGWGDSATPDNSYRHGRVLDALANQTGKAVVVMVGQGGTDADPGAWGPGGAFNHIAAAGLGSDIAIPPYDSRAPGSSYGPDNFWNPATGTTVPAVLASVDLAAPTRDLTVAAYGGGTASNLYRSNASGIAMATSIIAGGAALVIDTGKDRFGGGPSIDGRVVKAVLQNSATKLTTWDNGQTTAGGVVSTTQSLDYRFGAGRIDLARAFTQYTAGTTDLPGVVGGTAVQPIGWDLGEVPEGADTDFRIDGPLGANTPFTVTLTWFLDNSYDYATDTLVDQSLDNLDLEVWRVTPGDDVPDVLVARSISTYNNVEHLSFLLPQTAEYFVRVHWAGEVFDTVNDPNAETFALSWWGNRLPGDANVDGVVGPDDLSLVDRGYAMHLTGWSNGDFDGDGVVGQADYLVIDTALGQQAGSFPASLVSLRESQFGPSYVTQLLAAVPEPSLASAAVLLAFAAGRRRTTR